MTDDEGALAALEFMRRHKALYAAPTGLGLLHFCPRESFEVDGIRYTPTGQAHIPMLSFRSDSSLYYLGEPMEIPEDPWED